MRYKSRQYGLVNWFLMLSLVALFVPPLSILQAQVVQEPILEPGGPGAATNLRSEIDCSPLERRKGLARLQWTPSEKPGREQQVAVTIFRDGFETGQFEMSEPLPPTQSSLVFEAVQGQTLHRWRVLTLQPEGLVPSETARFEGPTCIFDVIPEVPVIR